MFKSTIKNLDLSSIDFSTPLFPDVHDRAFWDAKVDDSLIRDAEKYLTYEWPIIKATDYMEYKKTGNRLIMEDIHFGRRRALVTLAISELMENKGRFLPQIVNGIYAICEESYWGVSAHWYCNIIGNIQSPQYPYIDLFAAHTAQLLSVISKLLRDPLLAFCPEIIDRIDYEMDRRIFVPYLTHHDFWWMGYYKKVNNWNPWILSNVLVSFLLLENNPRRLREAVAKMLTEVTYYYDSMPEDGGCDEGPSYWARAGASMFEFFYQLKVATNGKLDFFADLKIKNIGSYITKVYIADGNVMNFGDGGQHITSCTLIYMYGKETNQPEMMSLASEITEVCRRKNLESGRSEILDIRRVLYSIMHDDEIESVKIPFAPGSLQYLPDLQIAALREGAWIAGVKGGNNGEFHNHNDVGSFLLYENGTPVLVDAGVGDYTRQTFGKERYTIWTMQSGYHNLPTVNGVDQKDGWKFRTRSFAAEEGCAKVSFASAYEESAGLTELTRTVTLDENGATVIDCFAFQNGSGKVVEHLMTPYKPEIRGNTVILDGKYAIDCDGGAISVDEVTFADNRKLSASWPSKVLYRINVAFADRDTVTLRIGRA